MATPLNLDVLEPDGFRAPAEAPDPTTWWWRSGSTRAPTPPLTLLWPLSTRRLRPGRSGPAEQVAPRTTGSALRAEPDALVLVSVPGPSAAAEAWDALDAGSHVMLFSDNVALDDEVALKRTASERGLLVMGPDCGTAVVGGVGLGFANAVRPGPVGARRRVGHRCAAVLSAARRAGVGVRHCLGVGGRDLGRGRRARRPAGPAAARGRRRHRAGRPGLQAADAGGRRPARAVAADLGTPVGRLLGADSPG